MQPCKLLYLNFRHASPISYLIDLKIYGRQWSWKAFQQFPSDVKLMLIKASFADPECCYLDNCRRKVQDR